jgi:ribosomal protein L14E/L6E/L27E
MELKTSRTLLPKHIYYAFLQQCEGRYPGTKIVKLNVRRRAIPYELHNEEGLVLMTYDRWFNMMTSFFAEARTRIIYGERLSMYVGGWIHGKRIERNFRNKRVNWKETMKTGTKWDEEKQKIVPNMKVYYTEPEYCRIGWSARSVAQRNYKFVPTNSSKMKRGFKQQFSKALTDNPNLKLSFIFYPYKP